MESSFKPKPILNRNELKQIKQSRTRVEGKKVITDDVRKLKSLKVTPDLAPDEQINYYKEPIWIEYYIPKESRFALETKYLYILLIPPTPRPGRDEILPAGRCGGRSRGASPAYPAPKPRDQGLTPRHWR